MLMLLSSLPVCPRLVYPATVATATYMLHPSQFTSNYVWVAVIIVGGALTLLNLNKKHKCIIRDMYNGHINSLINDLFCSLGEYWLLEETFSQIFSHLLMHHQNLSHLFHFLVHQSQSCSEDHCLDVFVNYDAL